MILELLGMSERSWICGGGGGGARASSRFRIASISSSPRGRAYETRTRWAGICGGGNGVLNLGLMLLS